MGIAQQLLVDHITFIVCLKVNLDHLYQLYKPLLVELELLEEQLQGIKKDYLYRIIPPIMNLDILGIHFQKLSRLSGLRKNYLLWEIVSLVTIMSHSFTLIQIKKPNKLLLTLQACRYSEIQLPIIYLLELIA